MPAAERAQERASERPEVSDESSRMLLRLAGAGMFILLIWFASIPEIVVPVGKYGIPITLQTLAVVAAAVCLGPRVGMLSVTGYLMLGALGWPVFAGGEYGIATLYGQTGGYLLGFVACQPVITSIVRRRDGTIRGWGAMIVAMVAGHAVIFALGVPWLWAARRFWLDDAAMTWGDAAYWGMVPYLPGMVIKSGIAVLIGRVAAPWASRRVW